MARKRPSAAERVAAYERRMKRRGMVKKHVWVPKARAQSIIGLAADLRRGPVPASRADFLARAIRMLRQARDFAERLGVRHAAVFGSVARGETDEGSDLDVLIEFHRPADLDLLTYLRVRRELSEALGEALGCPVDVIEAGSLRPELRPEIEDEAVFAF